MRLALGAGRAAWLTMPDAEICLSHPPPSPPLYTLGVPAQTADCRRCTCLTAQVEVAFATSPLRIEYQPQHKRGPASITPPRSSAVVTPRRNRSGAARHRGAGSRLVVRAAPPPCPSMLGCVRGRVCVWQRWRVGLGSGGGEGEIVEDASSAPVACSRTSAKTDGWRRGWGVHSATSLPAAFRSPSPPLFAAQRRPTDGVSLGANRNLCCQASRRSRCRRVPPVHTLSTVVARRCGRCAPTPAQLSLDKEQARASSRVRLAGPGRRPA